MKFNLLASALLTLLVNAAYAVSPGSLLTYEGILTDSGGTPITTAQTVTFKVLYGTCVMYSETQSISPGSAGEFSVIVGTGTRTDTTNNTADRIFASSGTVNCDSTTAVTMSGFSTRALRITVGSVDLTPDVTIGNIPVSINSQKLADKGASEFLQVSGTNTTQTNLNSLLNAYIAGTLTATTATSFTGSLAGDVSGTQTATSVDKIKGVAVDTTGLADGKILKYNSTTQKWAVADDSTGSGGISSLNGLTGTTQTFATGTAGTDFNITSVGTVHTFNIPTASATNRGLLSATDYVTFTGKVGSITVNTPLSNSGTSAAPVLSVAAATTTSQGVVQIGSGLAVSSGTVSADPSSFPSLVPITKGGTGAATATAAFAALSPMTTKGDLISYGTAPTVLGVGTTGQVLTVDSTQTTGLKWASPIATDLSSVTGTGIVQRTAANTYTTLGTASPLSVTGSNVVLNYSTGLTLSGSNLVVDTGTAAGKVVALDATAKLPAVDGSQLTNVVASSLASTASIAQGGTGATTKVTAFNNLSPATTKGDLITSDGTNNVRFPAGTTGQLLYADSAQTSGMTWATPNYFSNGGNSFGADATLGLADSFGLSIKTAGATRMHFNSSGNVGIGSTAVSGVPLTLSSSLAAGTGLHLVNTNSARNWSLNTGSLSSSYGTSAFAINDETAGKTRLLIDSTGAAAFGGTPTNINSSTYGPGILALNGPGSSITDSGILELNNNISPVSTGTYGGKVTFNAYNNGGAKTLASIQVLTDGSGGTNGYGGRILFTTKGDNSSTQAINFVMSAAGNVGIGITSPTYRLDVAGDVNVASTNVYRVGGTQVCSSSGCTSSSDRRLKENIQPLQDSLDNILKLDGVTYNYIDKTRFTGQQQVGVIAQDVEKVFPQVVITDNKTGFKSVAYDHLVAPLIEAVKSLYYKVVSSEEKIQEHERRIASIELQNNLDRTEMERLKKENEELKKQNETLQNDLNLIKKQLGL